MPNAQYINAAEFMQYLQAEGLVLVKASELVQAQDYKLARRRQQAFKKTWLTVREVLNLELGGIPKSRQGFMDWARKNLKQNELFVPEKQGAKAKIHTSGLKRLGFEEGMI